MEDVFESGRRNCVQVEVVLDDEGSTDGDSSSSNEEEEEEDARDVKVDARSKRH